jgi:hypothetical protein
MEAFPVLVWGPRLVGVLLLATGLLKALSPDTFFNHLFRLRIFPPARLRWITPLLVLGETTLGAALIFGFWPAVIWPLTIVILLALAGLTWWSTSTGRVEDCGCYQGMVEVTPAQSMGLNLVYSVLIAAALWFRPDSAGLEPARWLPVLFVAVATGALFGLTISRQMRGKPPLLDLSVLKPGRRWKTRWLPGATEQLLEGEHLVALLSTTCPYCKRWVKVLNLVHRRPDLPQVTGALVSSMEDMAVFAFTEGTRFPIVTARNNHVWGTLPAVPTAVHLVDGVIQHRWSGLFDAEFMERIRPGIGEKVEAHHRKLIEEFEAREAEAAKVPP